MVSVENYPMRDLCMWLPSVPDTLDSISRRVTVRLRLETSTDCSHGHTVY